MGFAPPAPGQRFASKSGYVVRIVGPLGRGSSPTARGWRL